MTRRMQFGGSLFAAVILMALTVWGKTYTFQATPVVPGATGKVDVKAAKAGSNTTVAVTVEHLARPRLLTPAANEYVVWIESDGGAPQNAGVLRVDSNGKGRSEVDNHGFEVRGGRHR